MDQGAALEPMTPEGPRVARSVRLVFWCLALVGATTLVVTIAVAWQIGKLAPSGVGELVAQAQLIISAIGLTSAFLIAGVTTYYAWQTRVLVLEMRASRAEDASRAQALQVREAVHSLVVAAGGVIAAGEALGSPRGPWQRLDVGPLFRAVADGSAALERVRLFAPELVDDAEAFFDLLTDYQTQVMTRAHASQRQETATRISDLRIALETRARVE